MPRIRIIALDHRFNVTDLNDIAAVKFWVRDSVGRTREYEKRDIAREAAETFEALGFVLEDETAPVPAVSAEDRARVRADVAALFGEIVSELAAEALEAVDADAIKAIGDLGEDRFLMAGQDGLDVYADGDVSRPYMTVPRGIAPDVARMLIEFWEQGYRQGFANGEAEQQRAMRRVLGVAA